MSPPRRRGSQDTVNRLVRRLQEIHVKISELSGGGVDAVLDPSGAPYLLPHAQQHLVEWEQHYRGLFEFHPNPMWLFDAETLQFLAVNQAAIDQYGYTRDEFLAMTIADIRPEEDVPGLRAIVDGVTSGACPIGVTRHKVKRGDIRMVDITAHATTFRGRKAVMALAVDVTERLAAEAALRDREARLQAILDAEPECVKIVSTGGVLTAMNPAGLRMVDADEPEQVIGEPVLTLIHPEDREAFTSLHRQVSRGGAGMLRFRIVSFKGVERWMETHSAPLRNADGTIAEVLSVTRDITAQVEAERELREQHALLSTAQRIGGMGSWDMDLQTGRLHWSPETCRLFGIAPDDFTETFDDFISRIVPEDRTAELQALERSDADGATIETEYRIQRPDGEIRWLLERGDVQFDAGGEPIRRVGMVMDITERKAAEARLDRSEAMLRMATTLSRMGAWSVDLPEYRITWSDEVCDIHEVPHGYTPSLDEAIGFYAPEWVQPIKQKFFACAEQGEPFDLELEIVTAKGRRVWIHTMGESVRDESGQIIRVQGAFQDISRSKAAEQAQHQLEDRLVRTLESMSDAFFTLDQDWRFQYLNHEAERVLRRTRLELLGRVVWDEFPEAVGTVFQTEYEKALATGQPVEFEAFYPPLDCWLGVHAFPSADGLAVYFSDISEKRQARQLLEESDRRFRELAGHVRDVFYNLDPHSWRMLYVSPAFEKVWGRPTSWTYENPRGFLETIHPDDRACAEMAVRDVMHGFQTEVEYRILRPDGSVRWILDASFPVFDDGGQLDRIVGTARDITDRKRIELEMRASEERFRLLSKATNDAIWDWDLTTDALWWNEGFEALFGYKRDEVEPTIESWSARIHPDDKEAVVAEVHTVIDGGGEYWSGEYRYRRADDTYAYVLDRGHVIRTPDGRAVRMVGGMTDLTERKAAEIRLAQQAALLDEASDAILVRDLDNRIQFWNRRAEEMYGWTAQEAINRLAKELIYDDPAALDEATAAVMHAGEWSGELEHRAKDGTLITVLARWTLLYDERGEPQAILAINADITERKRMERQFLRTQRMESIGTLASGIAHDLNNILSPILMAIEMLKEQEVQPETLSLIDTLQSSAQRGADLVRQILGIARGMESQRQTVDVRRIVGDVEKIARDTFPRNIELVVNAPEELWAVNGDATQLHQVLMNLCVNARDAMPHGGRLIFALSNIVLDDVYTGMNTHSKPGPYVVMRVEDTGTGMTKDVQEKVFEPFFTTKEMGRGTGLGLSTTFTIVKNHGGFIHLYSEPGKGTKFKVYLPAMTTFEAAEDVATAKPTLPRGDGEWVLLVDDEENIREITKKALERFGYRVLLACNGAEGVSTYVQHKDQIDVVLTDMSMPVMDGPSMIIALKAVDPAVRIIGSSGLAANGHVAKAIGAGVEHFVPKPYTAETLLSTLYEVLGKVGPGKRRSESTNAGPRLGGSSAEAEDRAPREKPATVLVVDDERVLRTLAARLLTRAGYDVLQAADGEEALAVVRDCRGAIDVVLTDVHMPRMDGEALFQAVSEEYPHVAFIFATGDGHIPESLAHQLEGRMQALAKPYSAVTLRKLVEQALES